MLALGAFGAVTFVAALATVSLYQRQRALPYRPYSYAPCEQDATATWCDSLQTIFSAGAILRGAGAVLLVAGVTLGALALLRMTRMRWLTTGAAVIASIGGVGALWLSQQALEAYYDLSLLPTHSFPSVFLQARLARIDYFSQIYHDWSATAIALALGILFFSLVTLWGAPNRPPQVLTLAAEA
jgi:hypothetical protein